MNKIRLAIVLIFLFVMGAFLTVQGASDIIKLNGYVPDFNYDSMADIKKGGFVQGYVENILDCYAGETTTNTTMGIETSSKISEEYFLMPLINDEDVEDELYVTVSASRIDDRRLLYAVCDDTWEYIDGNTDIDFTEMYIVARVKKMDDDLMPLMTEWFTSSGLYENASEARQHIIPYEFVIYQNLNAPYYSLIAGLVIIAAFAVAGVIVYKKMRPSYASAPDMRYSASSGNVSEASANGFAENVKAPVPIPDIPQPVQPDEFFARPERKSAAETEKKKEEVPAPAEQISASVPADMDSIDTSALSTGIDGSEYYDTADEDGGFEEYEFSGGGDFSASDEDGI